MKNHRTKLRHSIADVERDTGLSKDTLRVWERRYGFPTPERDQRGERQYDDEQLTRLRHVRRLLNAGHRPGQVVALPLQTLVQMGPTPAEAVAAPRLQTPSLAAVAQCAANLDHWMQLLRQHQSAGLRTAFEQHLQGHGLMALVSDGIAPMNMRVGQAWLDGQLAVFEEHLYTETVQAVLHHAIGQVRSAQSCGPPRVLLTTVPGEPHALGLLMAECVMVLEGCETMSLGVQTPLPDIVSAAQACRADVVALSFTALHNPRDVCAALQQLRTQLTQTVDLWAGGQCPALFQRTHALKRSGAADVEVLAHLQDIAPEVAKWRERQTVQGVWVRK